MIKLILRTLLIIITIPNQGLSQTMRIPVIPYNKSTSSVPTRIHNKCKSVVNYSNCVKRYLRMY